MADMLVNDLHNSLSVNSKGAETGTWRVMFGLFATKNLNQWFLNSNQLAKLIFTFKPLSVKFSRRRLNNSFSG